MARGKTLMTMNDWDNSLDEFLQFRRREILEGKVKVSREQMERKVLQEYAKYNTRRLKTPSEDEVIYREIKLKRDEDNVWQVVSDSFENHDSLLDDIVILLSEFMKDKEYHKSTPTELADEFSKNRDNNISPKTLTKKILQNTVELEKRCISAVIRKSNGKRLIEIYRQPINGIIERKRIKKQINITLFLRNSNWTPPIDFSAG